MGFSFKKVFKKSEEKGSNIVFGDAPETEPAEVESRAEASATPSLPPPPLEGDFASPFQVGEEEILSPFDMADQPASGDRLQATDAQAQAPPANTEPAPVVGQPATPDPAAEPLATSYDDQTAQDLENKGFRPLSSLPTTGDAPPVTPSMDLPPSNQPTSPDRQPSPFGESRPQSPFESSSTRPNPFAGDPPKAPEQPAQPASPFEIAAPTPPPAQATSPFESAPAAPVPSGPIPTPVEPSPPMPTAASAAPLQQPMESDSVDLPNGALEDRREFVEMNVQQLLSAVTPAELGLQELGISPFAKTRIPMAMLRPQLPTGQVFLNVSDIIVGCNPEHRAQMVGCNPTVRLRVPLGLIFPSGDDTPAPAAAPAPTPATSRSHAGSRSFRQAANSSPACRRTSGDPSCQPI